MKVPDGYQTIMPYLIVENAAGFLEFTKSVFGATERHTTMREDNTTIMHAEVSIGGSVIMFAEATDQYNSSPAGLFIYVEDADKTYQDALDAGATSIMPPADQNYGRSSGVKDAFGNQWWITTGKE